MMRLLICAATALYSIVFFSGCYDRLQSSAPLAVEDPAAAKSEAGAERVRDAAKVDLQILDYSELERLIASYRGKVVVLDCWSTSCAPCIAEFPNLVALQHRHSREELACVSLSFDFEGIGKPEDEYDRVLGFLEKQAADFDNVLSRLDSDALTARLEIPSIPAVFVYDRQGNQRRRFDNRNASREGGPFTYRQVGEYVEQLLAERVDSAE